MAEKSERKEYKVSTTIDVDEIKQIRIALFSNPSISIQCEKIIRRRLRIEIDRDESKKSENKLFE